MGLALYPLVPESEASPMNDNTPPTRTPTDGSGLTSRVSPQPYAPPAVVWRETYVPEAFGVS